ncbi:MAG: cob(I)yrinic acid a,c-diamide adenosyltransferase [Eubacteriales bacterium]|nr:cob(I)yrinic acid a,c-diamide adenosyltransferase [Eubacteriales bacterium]
MSEDSQKRGLIHIYCGDGKGKTTCSVGLTVRASGDGFHILFTQFMKTGKSSEIRVMESLPGIDIMEMPRANKFSFEMTDEEIEDMREKNGRAFGDMIRRVTDGGYDMLVMDEVVNAVKRNLLDNSLLVEFLKNKPRKLEVVMTGRDPGDDIIELADYVSEIRKVKHPYDQGIRARRGIEF